MQRRTGRQAKLPPPKRPSASGRPTPTAPGAPLSPKAERLLRQAEAAQQRNELGAARDLLEEAIRWAPHVDLYLAYADIAERGGGTERAISTLQAGIKRFPTAAPLYISHAALLVSRGRSEQAASSLKRGINRNP